MNIKRIVVVFIVIMLILVIPIKSYAGWLGNILDSGREFIQNGENQVESADANTEIIDENKMKDVSNQLYNVFLSIGVIVAVFVGSILGIQFMTGSIEQQAKVKESLYPFVLGCIVIFGAFGIWKIIVTVLQRV